MIKILKTILQIVKIIGTIIGAVIPLYEKEASWWTIIKEIIKEIKKIWSKKSH